MKVERSASTTTVALWTIGGLFGSLSFPSLPPSATAFAVSPPASSASAPPKAAAAAATMSPSSSLSALRSSSTSSSSYLDSVPLGPPDAILGIASDFRSCSDPRKVNVCVGAYRDSSGRPWVLPSVREAERRLLEDESVHKEYAPIDGDAEFVSLATKFAYGNDAPTERIAAVQSLSGTGACRVGGTFLAKFLPAGTRIYLPTPTWGNHVAIFEEAGLDVRRYRYYDPSTNSLDFEGMTEDIREAPGGSVILFHACAHNPTGCDPTLDQWRSLSDLTKEKNHVAFFDSAYQGFASGNAERDASALRLFVEEGHNLLLAQSFAKNFGLYGERCGTLSVVCPTPPHKDRVLSQLKLVIRPMYSSPPIHGSSIVKTVLADENLSSQYCDECRTMANRIRAMRELFVDKLREAGSEHDWSHVTDQIGMFAYTGMSSDMCERLTSEHAIYLTKDGRISVAGLNEDNVEYVARAVREVTRGKSVSSAASSSSD